MRDKRQLLFVQGGGKDTHNKWDDKLVASLRAELGPDFEIRYPRMPNEHEPEYELWKAALQGELATLGDSKEACDEAIGFGEGLRETFEQLDELLAGVGASR